MKQIRENIKSILKLQIMNHRKYLKFSAAIFLLIGSFSWAQFIEVNAELDLRRISEGDRQLFITLAEDIENYFLNTQFSATTNDLEIIVVCVPINPIDCVLET